MTAITDQPDAATGSCPALRVHPLWARPVLLAWAVAVVLLYGSLLPFDFAWSRAVERSGGVGALVVEALTSPRWVSAAPGASSLGVPLGVSDVLVNVLLYVPLGVCLRMAIRPRLRHRFAQVGGAVLLAFMISWLVESLQSLMPARVASVNDVLANTSGACIAAVVAPMLWGWYKRLVFASYCRLAWPIACLRGLRDRPIVAIMIAMGNALVIGVWYVFELQRSGLIKGISNGELPFERAFELPYDLGAVVLGRALLVYAGLGCLLLLLTCTGGRRIAMGWVVLAVALMALAAELSRAATHDAMPDVTGPLLALAAAALMSITVYTFSLAVKRSNRRRHSQQFTGPDRRRMEHHYGG